ncbi:MAG: Crp/Fnr family transcriptional regulator [Bacteroidetes bacterium]|nr:Crp/Fnr family transcriptional regulator [Bacteroidota bacterium]
MEKETIISHILKHITLSKAEADLFASVLETKHIARKEYLLRIGDICRYDYFVNNGCLKVCYIDEKGVECIIKFAIEDSWVVDLDSFLNLRPAFYYMQAIEDTTVCRISKLNHDMLHEQIPAFQKFSNMRWQNGFIALQRRIQQSLSMPAEERYSSFKEKYPGLEQRIPQKLIAAYLGVTPEFFSLMKKKALATIS